MPKPEPPKEKTVEINFAWCTNCGHQFEIGNTTVARLIKEKGRVITHCPDCKESLVIRKFTEKGKEEKKPNQFKELKEAVSTADLAIKGLKGFVSAVEDAKSGGIL